MPELESKLTMLSAELDRRTATHKRLDPYYEGDCHLPVAVTQARLTNMYRYLMPMAQGAWGSLVVESVLDRLEPKGIGDPGGKAVEEAVWGFWQDNCLDSESKLAHNAALVDGRSFGVVWPDETGTPEVTLEDATQMIVQYRAGSRRKRIAALRRWQEDERLYATLYQPDGIYKFVSKEKHHGVQHSSTVEWVRREVPNEMWPLANPLKKVPVVELAVNRRLKPGQFGYAKGEYERHIGLIDRINLLTFLGLVVAIWMGFPLRGIIGEKIARDDDGNTLPPFESKPDSVFQFENPEAKLAEFKAADRKNLSIYSELAELAMLTKTPRHYFPQEGGLQNVSADTIRADEGALAAKVTGHKASLGEGWEEVLRLGGMMLKEPVELSPRAELGWYDHESRSLAERADAASKLKDVLPPLAVAELALNVSDEQISRWEAQAASSALTTLIKASRESANGVPTS